MINVVNDDIDTIINNSLRRKPRRHVIVAEKTPIKKVIGMVKSELTKREKQFFVFNVSDGAYMFVLENMSTIEIIDKSIYNGKHYSHLIAKDGDEPVGYRIFRYVRLA